MATESNENLALHFSALRLENKPNATQPLFNTLNQFQNLNTISRLFSNGKKLIPEKSPLFIVLIGSPGVGKTSTATHIFEEHNWDINTFYKISLDTLVERVKPYRNLTRNAATHYRQGKDKLNNNNYQKLSTIYSSYISTRHPNFKANQTRRRVLEGIKPNTKQGKLKSLNDLLWEGMEHAINQGYNILYDTTIASNGEKIKTEVMNRIEEYEGDRRYTLVVIHITADKEQIERQLKKRHNRMLENKYIRAIPPKLIGKFLKDNKEGFDNVQEYFESKEYLEDFPDAIQGYEFIEKNNEWKNSF